MSESFDPFPGLTEEQKGEFGRFSRIYTPEGLNNNNLTDGGDLTKRAFSFAGQAGLAHKYPELGLTSEQDGEATYRAKEPAHRVSVGLYTMKKANNLQGERAMMQSMGIDVEGAVNAQGGKYDSFAAMVDDPDNAHLRPTDAEIARFEELTGFDRSIGRESDHSAAATRDRLFVPKENREAFAQFRDEYLADRGLEYNTLEHGERVVEPEGTEAARREAEDAKFQAEQQERLTQQPQQGNYFSTLESPWQKEERLAQQQSQQGFSQGFGGMADSFVAEHDAQQAARSQQPQFGATAGRTMTQDGPELG